MTFNIKTLIKTNSFFEETKSDIEKINFITEHNHEIFKSSDMPMYYFNLDGYKVSFLIDKTNKTITEQVEFNTAIKPKDDYKSFNTIENFKDVFKNDIEAIYTHDTGETVIFIKSGSIIYFQNSVLEKITSKNTASRHLASSIMKKVKNL